MGTNASFEMLAHIAVSHKTLWTNYIDNFTACDESGVSYSTLSRSYMESFLFLLDLIYL